MLQNAFKALILAIFFLEPTNALTHKQIRTIKLCYKVGSKYNLGNTLAGICWVESQGGKYLLNQTTEDYGIAGINIKTALAYLKEPDTYWNRIKVASMLVRNDRLVLKIAIHELIKWRKKKKVWFEYVSAYNRGWVGSYEYARKVSKAIKFLKRKGVIK